MTLRRQGYLWGASLLLLLFLLCAQLGVILLVLASICCQSNKDQGKWGKRELFTPALFGGISMIKQKRPKRKEEAQKGLFGFRRQLDSEEERRSGAKRVEMIHGAFAHLFRGRAPFNI